MTLPVIFCPQCDTLILEAVQCPACQWRRPLATGQVGQVAWTVALEAKLPRREGHPTAVAGSVYLPTENSQIVALNVNTPDPAAALTWRYQLDSRFRCQAVAVWQDYLLLGSEYTGGFPTPTGELLLLSVKDGNEVWRWPVEGASLSTPIVNNDVAYFTVNTGWVYAVDLIKRRELRRFRVPSPWSWSPAAPCLTSTGQLILSSRSDQLVAIQARSGELAWTFKAGGWFPHTSVFKDGLIYVRCWDRHVYALDSTTGQEVWRYRASRDYSSDIWVGEQYLYLGAKDYQDGAESGPRAYALYTLDRRTGQRVGRYQIAGHIYARPIATDEAVFFATDDRELETANKGTLYALDPSGQRRLWLLDTVAHEFQSDLLLLDHLIVAGTRSGAVYAVRWQAIETKVEAPGVYLERGEWENAAIAYAGQGDFVQAAEIYAQRLAQPLRAGRLYWQAGDYRRVIELLGRSQVEAEHVLAVKAAQALPKAAQRAKSLRDLGEFRAAAEAFTEAEAWLQAGECFEAIQAWAEARAAYAYGNAWDKWERLTRELQLWDELTERLLQKGDDVKAAEVYQGRGLFLKAAECYERAGLAKEAVAAYRQANPELLTKEARRRLAELAETANEVDIAIQTYAALREWAKAASLAEVSGRYEQATNLYQQAGQLVEAAELLVQMARYAEASALFAQDRHWGRAALNLERHVDQFIERAGGVRKVRRDAQVEEWLNQAMTWFEEGANVAEEATKVEAYNQGLERCRLKLRQIRGEPVLSWSLKAGSTLLVDEGNTLHYTVENVGWGTAEAVTLAIGGNFLHSAAIETVGSLKRNEKKAGPITVVPKMTGEVTLRVEWRGRSDNGEFQEEPFSQQVTVLRQGIASVEVEVGLHIQNTVKPRSRGTVWDESHGSSGGKPESAAVSPEQLKQQRIASLRRQLAQHYANRDHYREQAAIYGGEPLAPAEIQNRIKIAEKSITEIEDTLSDLTK